MQADKYPVLLCEFSRIRLNQIDTCDDLIQNNINVYNKLQQNSVLKKTVERLG